MDSIQQIKLQRNLLVKFAKEHANENDVAVEYYDSFGKYPCLSVAVGQFIFEMDYRPQDDPTKNEIRTKIFYIYIDKAGYQRSKCFMIKRDAAPAECGVFAKVRSDYHVIPVTYSTWADKMMETVMAIRDNREQFLKLCKLSCPYNEDGSHRFKSWKSNAKVEIIRVEDNPLIQGLKGGETPTGAHVVGGCGSFRVFNKGDYGLRYTIEILSGEKPLRGVQKFVPFDQYLRAIRDKLGYSRSMPYKVLNAKLPERLEVITYDMDKDPEERDFVPVGYDGSWQVFLQECFKDL